MLFWTTMMIKNWNNQLDGSIVFTLLTRLCARICHGALPRLSESPVADPSPPLYIAAVGGYIWPAFHPSETDSTHQAESINCAFRTRRQPAHFSWIQQQWQCLGQALTGYVWLSLPEPPPLPTADDGKYEVEVCLTPPAEKRARISVSPAQEAQSLCPWSLILQILLGRQTENPRIAIRTGNMTHNAHLSDTGSRRRLISHAWLTVIKCIILPGENRWRF